MVAWGLSKDGRCCETAAEIAAAAHQVLEFSTQDKNCRLTDALARGPADVSCRPKGYNAGIAANPLPATSIDEGHVSKKFTVRISRSRRVCARWGWRPGFSLAAAARLGAPRLSPIQNSLAWIPTSSPWHDRYLAASVFQLRGSTDRDNALVQRTRAALGA
jgi:hypothetical protein